MKGRAHVKHIGHLLTRLLGAGACFGVTALPALSQEGPPASTGQTRPESGASVPQPPAERAPGAPESAPGMMIHIDPQTGAIRKEPAPGTVPLVLSPQLQRSLSTSHQGLSQVPSPLPGGGVKLHLQGRFQSPLAATADGEGKVKTQHIGEPHEPGHQQ